jgi:hypothetical protein
MSTELTGRTTTMQVCLDQNIINSALPSNWKSQNLVPGHLSDLLSEQRSLHRWVTLDTIRYACRQSRIVSTVIMTVTCENVRATRDCAM